MTSSNSNLRKKGASKKTTKKAPSKKTTKKVASKKTTKKAPSKKTTKKAPSKKTTKKVASKKTTKKVASKKTTKKVALKRNDPGYRETFIFDNINNIFLLCDDYARYELFDEDGVPRSAFLQNFSKEEIEKHWDLALYGILRTINLFDMLIDEHNCLDKEEILDLIKRKIND